MSGPRSPPAPKRNSVRPLNLQRCRHRYVVGRTPRTAVILGHRDIRDAIGQHARRPDMVEPAALVGFGPVRRPITPPRLNPLRFRHEGSYRVDPAAGPLHAEKFFALD